MQTWKIKKRGISSKKAKSQWPLRLAGILLLLATLAAAVYDFPFVWNKGAEYVQAETGWSAPRLSDTPYRLGLDLQGGTHLVYEADMSQIPDGDRGDALQGVRDVIERRVNAFGVSEPVVQTTTTGGTYRVIVELAGVLDVSQAINEIGETPILEFKVPGQELDHEPTEEELATLAEKQAEDRTKAEDVFTQAKNGASLEWENVGPILDSSETYKPIVDAIKQYAVRPGNLVPAVIETPEGLNVIRYIGTTPSEEMLLSHILFCWEGKIGCENPTPEIDATIRLQNATKEITAENFGEMAAKYSDDKSTPDGDLGWILPGDTVATFEAAALATPVGTISEAVETDFGYHIIYKRDAKPIQAYEIERVLIPLSDIYDVIPPVSPWKNSSLSGKQLARASVQFDPNTGAPMVSLQFNDEGAQLFGELTAAYVGQPIAIFLDGEAISTPNVSQAIYGGEAVITGDFTLEEAKLLAQRLNAGALPVPVHLLSQETVGPTLGAASLQTSVMAALIGFALVSLFMLVVYRLPGFLAVLALVLYALMNLAMYRIFGVTVTLSGIAGLVLTFGIAVDANVLIFERMKDEFRTGRDLASSIDEGFKRAWPPIRDGHMTTLISAGVLYMFSSSFVKGFALTLAIGVLLSLFTAVIVTRAYMRNVYGIRFLRSPALYGVKPPSKNA